MAVFKCKMCGGALEITENQTVCECEYCGTTQTLPKLTDDRKANMYDRANHFRRNNEFDKAMGIYEQILNEDNTDAEAYWSIVLCRYGIEYVEDPASHKRIPTVNRAQYTFIFDDGDYRSALEYADSLQKTVYEEEAKNINEIQKGILEISQKEEPFDVFICYKETDANGRRTQDSVLANDLYHQLTQEGLKVFFARITLEDKLGSAYEPYIFAALNSAKVMVVLGTRPEYFSAVWVKNEWSRYLALVRQSAGKKMLIPAYRDMDPYDLPEEFSHLQAQDMSKLGFMQDLIRGIKKILQTEEAKTTVPETIVMQGSSNANTDPLLKRVFIFLEDGDFDSANEYCEKVLDIEPECAEAYLGKLMAELKVKKQEDLKSCKKPFDQLNNYQKAIRFGDDKLKKTLAETIEQIEQRIENDRLTKIYNDTLKKMNSATTESEYLSVAKIFKSISGFQDADIKAEICLEKAEISRKDEIYMSAKRDQRGDTISLLESAIQKFSSVPDWEDAEEQVSVCRKRIEEIKEEEERRRLEEEQKAKEERIAAEKRKKRNKMIAVIGSLFVIACIAFWIVLNSVKLNKAMSLIETGDYEQAIMLLNGLNYKDSDEKLKSIEKIVLSKAEVGSTVWLGNYEQDNNESNGNEPIEWIVLDKQDNKVLVISKYALDSQKFAADYQKHSNEYLNITWETRDLRKWMNETFLKIAFSTVEQEMIVATNVAADKNPEYGTSPGNITNDKIFLLSITEVIKYFSTDSERQCQGTAYCYAQGAYKGDNNNNCYWWLRSPGRSSSRVTGVFVDGSIEYDGKFGCDTGNAVRPAMWIDLNS